MGNSKPRQYDGIRNPNYKHGLSKHPLHRVWRGMIQRCHNKNYKHFDRYGGRGIIVCGDWLNNFKSFYDWCMINGYKRGLTIDREDNNGNYDPFNCRWVTNKINQRNKEKMLCVEYKGEIKPLSEWCDLLNLKYITIYQRIYKRKQSHEEALSTPVQKQNKKYNHEKTSQNGREIRHRFIL